MLPNQHDVRDAPVESNDFSYKLLIKTTFNSSPNYAHSISH